MENNKIGKKGYQCCKNKNISSCNQALIQLGEILLSKEWPKFEAEMNIKNYNIHNATKNFLQEYHCFNLIHFIEE